MSGAAIPRPRTRARRSKGARARMFRTSPDWVDLCAARDVLAADPGAQRNGPGCWVEPRVGAVVSILRRQVRIIVIGVAACDRLHADQLAVLDRGDADGAVR